MVLNKHALILGASGISGWSLVNQARSYPSEKTFTRITALSNRPLSFEQACIPEEERIKLVHGVDFTKDVEKVKGLLKEKINDIDTVTHVYFTAYIAKDDYESLVKVNDQLLRTAVTAIESLAPKLESVILQAGGKAYGVEFKDKVEYNVPLKESAPRIPEPYASNVFYYSQHDILKSLSAGKPWSYIEVRPDVIVGFVPGDNAMDLARGIAIYLSLYRIVKGVEIRVPFPGTSKSWKALHTDTSQAILSRFELYASLKPATCGKGEAYNIADASKPTTWEEKWPRICEYFGLNSDGPLEDGKQGETKKFVEANKAKWDKAVKDNGLKMNALETYEWNFMDAIFIGCDFDRHYSLMKARLTGFEEEIDTVLGYYKAFDMLREAKIIPQQGVV